MSGLNRTRWGLFFGMTMGFNTIISTSSALAQIKPDSTLPNNSSVSLNGQTFNINGGTQAGRNLFHSFQEFSVPNGFTASINNAADIRNIFGRVTGGSISNIDGLIKASGTANLFLINPSGIVFGKNARLNIGGSFMATTANRLKFADGFEFIATDQPTSLLTVSVPIGLQFGNNPGDILNKSTDSSGQTIGLQVQPGKTLALVGGNVSLDGGIVNAPSGRVELGGVSQPGILGLNVDGDIMSLIFPDGVNRASVSLKNFAAVDVSGDGSGSIAINARNLDILGQSNLKADVTQSFDTNSLSVGGITLNATESIRIRELSKVESAVSSNNAILNDSNNASLHGSNINLTTGSLLISDGAQLNLRTNGYLNAGNVSINASNVSFDGKSNGDASGIVNIVQRQSTGGNGGNISITTGTLSLTNGGIVNAITIGQGVTGNVKINASDRVSLDGSGTGIYNLINNKDVTRDSGGINITTGTLSATNGSQINTSNSGKGNVGDINIKSGDVSLSNGSVINLSTSGQGKAGNVIIDASDRVSLDGNVSGIVNIVQPESTGGNGGNISIKTGTLLLTNGGIVNAISNGQGATGIVTIDASDRISLDGNNSVVNNLMNNKDAIGNSGGINIKTGTLSTTNGAQLNTSTNGKGNAGDVTINARDRISFDRSNIFTGVNDSAIGKGGNISITTGTLLLTNDAQLNTSTSGTGNAGGVTIEAGDRVSFNKSNVFTGVNDRAKGTAGDISIKSGDISFANGSYIILSTNGQGDAGNATFTSRSLSLTDGSLLTTSSANLGLNAGEIRIKATDSVSLSGNNPINKRSTEISSDTLNTATGRVGNITVDTNAFRISDGAIINARTTSTTSYGTGGSITINSKTFEATNGGELLTVTSGSANAGKITVNATDRVIVDGSDPTVNDRRIIFKASPERGNLANVEAASGFFVRSSSSGSAGDIEVNAPQIRLDNSGKFSAESTFGNGGNITLNPTNLLQLRRSSLISTSAITANQDGNGGNITINAPNGFIVAVPNENNYITANAFKGSGGLVQINATSIYGLKVLNREDLVKIPDFDLVHPDFQQLPSSITAISQTNPNLNGQVNINTPGIDPSRGLVALPTQIVDASKQLVANCSASGGTTGNSFIVTGRGGLPPNPDELLSPDVVWSDTRLPTVQQQALETPIIKSKPQSIAIIPATGWVFNAKGEVTLISSIPNATGNTSTLPTSCLKRE